MKKLAAMVLAPVIGLLLGSPALGDDAHVNGRVDVNTASAEQLKATLGVDDAEAQKIIEARPYFKKDDLKDRHVLSVSEFEKLQKLIESIC